MLAEFGVNSEVGKLRKVMVHRPELSLQLLTPTNHDELLFDDVLWVERETAADPRILALALAVIGITLVTFLVTTLADEPASIVTLLAILLVSVGLDIGWSRRRDSTTTQIGGS